MQGDKRIDKLMLPVLNAINRHVKDRDAKTDIYNRAYEAVMISMVVKTSTTGVKTPPSIENTNCDYYKGVEKSVVDKSALVRLCGVLGVLTENNDLATAALLAATRIEVLEKKIPALNVDLAEASMHAYNGEIARMKLEAQLASRDASLLTEGEQKEILSYIRGNYDRDKIPCWLLDLIDGVARRDEIIKRLKDAGNELYLKGCRNYLPLGDADWAWRALMKELE